MSGGLRLRRYGVAFADQIVIASVTLQLRASGVFALLGPAGAGKSTLLRTLAGLNDAQPALRTWGTATLGGLRVGPGNRPAMVAQDARLLLSSVRDNLVDGLTNRAALTQPEQSERIVAALRHAGLGTLVERLDDHVLDLPRATQRCLAMVRAELSGPQLLFLDEPTADLDEPEASEVLDMIERLGGDRSVLLVTHNRGHARRVADHVGVLAGGRLIEAAATDELFEHARIAETADFLRTGGCRVPGPNARRDELASDVAPPTPLPPRLRAVAAARGPRDFYWLDEGRLGGLPRPGIVADAAHDVEALARLGVTVLINLEEQATVSAELLREHGIDGLHFPIEDMGVPTVSDAIAQCGRVERLLQAGDVVAMHCRAGLGRTGTMLACQLVFRGWPPAAALDRVRRLRPRSVESIAQVDLLTNLSRALLRGTGTVRLETE